MNCELFLRTAQLWLRTVFLLYHWSAAAAAAIAAASRVLYGLQILSCCVVVVVAVYSLLYCHYLARLCVDFPNYNDNKDHWGTGLIRSHNRMTHRTTHGGEYGQRSRYLSPCVILCVILLWLLVSPVPQWSLLSL